MNDELLRALLTSLEQRESVALLNITNATDGYEESIGNHRLLWLESSRAPMGDLSLGTLTSQIDQDARQALRGRQHRHLHYETTNGTVHIFVEVQVQPPHLIIVGAGHIAVPLASIASTCDFEVTVLDDRPQYAHPARFPTADHVIAGPFRAEIRTLRNMGEGFGNHTYMVLITRGHQYDVESLLEVLDDPLAYIGMIGSKRRIRAVFQLLETEQNIPPHKFDRVYAPVGLNIGARTPAEIAISIMAEIINVMRHGPAVPMGEELRRDRQARKERLQRVV